MNVDRDNVSHVPVIKTGKPISTRDEQRRDFCVFRHSQTLIRVGDTVHIVFTPFEAQNTTTRVKGTIKASSRCFTEDEEFIGHRLAILTNRNTRYTVITHNVDKYDSVVLRESLTENDALDNKADFYGCDVEIHTEGSWKVQSPIKQHDPATTNKP